MGKGILAVIVGIGLAFTGSVCAQEQSAAISQPAKAVQVVLLIAEQNIEGPQRAWWASEIDLSTTEMGLASALTEQGFTVIDPSSLQETFKQKPAFRAVSLSESDSASLGSSAGADYVVLGKAVASAGAMVPQSSMRSCFANVTVKVLRVADHTVVAYLDAAGNSVHLDVVTGGAEALRKAAANLAPKIVQALNKERAKE